MSDVTAHAIDEEVRRLIDSNYQRAKDILERNLDKLHKMAEALIKYETIDESQIKDIMEGRDPKPPAGWDDTTYADDGWQDAAIARRRRRRSASRPVSTDVKAAAAVGPEHRQPGRVRRD